MQRRRVGAATVLVALVGICCGCGGGGNSASQPPPASGNTTVFVTDAAADNVLAFAVDVTAASLVDSSGHAVSVSGLPRHLELRHLELAPAILFQAGLPAGNYTSLNLTLANVEIDVAASGGAVRAFNPYTSPAVVISNSTISLPISLSVTANGTPGLMADFDLRSSLTNDASGNYIFNPVVLANSLSSSDPGWQLAGARGQIVSLSGSSINVQLFDGNFTIPLQVNSNTQFSSDLQGISSLSAGQAVEVTAQFNNGTYTAVSIDSDGDPATAKRGIVTGGPTGNGTPVAIVVQD